MTLSEAVEYYHSLEKFGIQPGLERITLLCEKLGSPHKKLKFIHVAGTNGKGSTCTAIAGVLTKAGFRTGLYTSPYVIDFRERIQLNMQMISPEALIKVTEQVSAGIEELSRIDIKITEFEAVTAAALLYYDSEHCDFVVLETGLGGRFDATNIIDAPLCSVITSVSLDHVSILGNTLGEIAFEKSGIIKNGCPVITGIEQPAEVMDVIKSQAQKMDSALVCADSIKLFSLLYEDISGTVVSSPAGELKIPYCGTHQLNNMALVFAVVDILRKKGVYISDEAVKNGIGSFSIPARTEIISSEPLVILDGSHNDGSTAALAEALKKHLSGKKILSVMGMMADKDCAGALSHLMPCFSEIITVKPSNPRSMEAEKLADIAKQFAVKSTPCPDPREGVKRALSVLNRFDALIVCGSLYLAGDVRDYLINNCGGLTAEK